MFAKLSLVLGHLHSIVFLQPISLFKRVSILCLQLQLLLLEQAINVLRKVA